MAPNHGLFVNRAPSLRAFCPSVQRSAEVGAPGLVNFITAVAYHFCPSLPAAFTQPGTSTLADLCSLIRESQHGSCPSDNFFVHSLEMVNIFLSLFLKLSHSGPALSNFEHFPYGKLSCLRKFARSIPCSNKSVAEEDNSWLETSLSHKSLQHK